MRLIYKYEKKEDIWCLLNKGKASNNSQKQTKVYEQLIAIAGVNPDETSASKFIDEYIIENKINISECIINYQNEFNSISNEFQKIAEKVFGVSLEKDITVYLTVNNRCPYGISENVFFVSISNNIALNVAMHELWHFYTWYKFGKNEAVSLGGEKYNDIKEALTCLLNVECGHLLLPGTEDVGYPQHQDLRKEILRLWKINPNIDFVWKKLVSDYN